MSGFLLAAALEDLADYRPFARILLTCEQSLIWRYGGRGAPDRSSQCTYPQDVEALPLESGRPWSRRTPQN
jgi:hypothetical protein